MRKGSEAVVFRVLLGWVLAALLVACAPRIGDECSDSTDCSVQGDRECDKSARGGYCTVENCVPGSCMGEGYCVRFEPDQLRLATSWCMAKCGRGCRSGYRCVDADDLNAERCEVTIDEYRELLDREDADGNPSLELEAVRLCMRTLPRMAQVLDDDPEGRFCVQASSQEMPSEP